MDADVFFWQFTSKVSLSEYGGLVALRGLCYHNTVSAGGGTRMGGMRVFRKPDLYEKARTRRDR